MNNGARPTIWFRNVYDTFTLFNNKDTAFQFLSYLNSRHKDIQFTVEFEQDHEIPFLDVLIKRLLNNSFSSSIYQKKMFTGLYSQWDSLTPRKYKINLIRTLTYRCLRICSSPWLVLSAITSYADVLRLATRNHQRTEVTSPLSRRSWEGTRDRPKTVYLEGYVCYKRIKGESF